MDADDPTALLPTAPRERPSDTARGWRRRTLLRKGARLYSSLGATTDVLSVAMLDEDGIVIAWYESARDLELPDPPIVHRHVSELYVAEDIATGIPGRDLCTATLHGASTQQGWRHGSDGSTMWATTVIKPVLMRDGTLQGFSYVTHRAATPWTMARPIAS